LTHRTASGDFAYARGVIHASEYHRLTGVDAMSLPEEHESKHESAPTITRTEPTLAPVTVALRELGTSASVRGFLSALPNGPQASQTPPLHVAGRGQLLRQVEMRGLRSSRTEITSSKTCRTELFHSDVGSSAKGRFSHAASTDVDEYTSPSEGEYRAGFTFAQSIAFVREEDRNPKTGRPIERFGPTWRSLNQAAIAWGLRKDALSLLSTQTDEVAHPTPEKIQNEAASEFKVSVAAEQLEREAAPHAIAPVLAHLRAFLAVLRASPTRPSNVAVQHILRHRNGRWLITGLWNATRVVFTVRDDPNDAKHEADMIALAADSAVPLIAFGGHVIVTEYVSDVTLASDERAMQLRSASSFSSLIETVVSLCSVVQLSTPLSPSQLIANVDRDVTWYVSADWDAARPSGRRGAASLHLFCLARALQSPLLADTLLNVFDSWTEEQRNVLNRL